MSTLAEDLRLDVPHDESDGIYPIARRRRAWAAVALLGMLTVLDSTIANVALPTIGRDLHASPAATVWVTNAFQLAVTAMLFTAAALGATRGLARTFLIGVGVFAVGSLLCAFSSTLPLLIGARIIQGAGGAMVMAVSPALTREIFPRAELGKAFGLMAMSVGVAGAAGPTVGGAMLAILPWPWLFAINVPFVVVVFALARGALPSSHATYERIDVPSMLASAIGFTTLVYGLDGFGRNERPLSIAIESLAGAAVFAWFAQRQFQLRVPMVALDLFLLRPFRMAAGTSFAAWMSAGICVISLPYLFQVEYGYTPLASGLVLTSWPIATAIAAPIAGRFADRYSPGVIATIGLGIYAASLALFATISGHASPATVVAIGALCGVGFGTFQSPNNREIMGNAPDEKSGSAAALLATLRVGAQTVGASVVGIVFALYETTYADPAQYVRLAAPAALWVACASAAVAAVVSGRRAFKR